MVPLATNGTIGKISNGTIGRIPNARSVTGFQFLDNFNVSRDILLCKEERTRLNYTACKSDSNHFKDMSLTIAV